MRQHPWFEQSTLPRLRQAVRDCMHMAKSQLHE